MKKQLFFLHSGGPQGKHEGSGELVAWLEAQLGPEYELRHPIMPHPEAPDYEAWKPHLREALSRLHDGAQLIGHSLGGSLLLKYLAEEKISFSIGTLFLVSAPFWGGDEDWQHPAFQLPADFPKTMPPIPKIFLYHSKNDPIVSVTHLAMYKAKFPQSTVRELDGNEHVFDKGLPELFRDIQKA